MRLNSVNMISWKPRRPGSAAPLEFRTRVSFIQKVSLLQMDLHGSVQLEDGDDGDGDGDGDGDAFGSNDASSA